MSSTALLLQAELSRAGTASWLSSAQLRSLHAQHQHLQSHRDLAAVCCAELEHSSTGTAHSCRQEQAPGARAASPGPYKGRERSEGERSQALLEWGTTCHSIHSKFPTRTAPSSSSPLVEDRRSYWITWSFLAVVMPLMTAV